MFQTEKTRGAARRLGARAAAALLSLALAACCLSGCGAGGAGQSGPEPKGADSGVISARESFEQGEQLTHVYSNPLETEFVDISIGGNITGNYIKLHGFADPAVEKKVNDLIFRAAMDLATDTETPPYIGAAVEFRNKVPTDRSVYSQLVGSFNNIASISMNVYQQFKPADGSESDWWSSYSAVKTLNIDLRTGDEIKLRDLFKEGTDGIAFLNSCMERYIAENDCYDDTTWTYMNGFFLRDSFRGVDEDQQFVISNWNGCVSLYFDWRDTEVQTEFYPVSVRIDDNSRFDYDKFLEGGSVFAGKQSVPRLLEQELPLSEPVELPRAYSFAGRNIDYHGEFAGSSLLSDAQNRALTERTPEETAMADGAIRDYDRFAKTYGMLNARGSFYEEGSASAIGPFRIIRRYVSYYVYSEGDNYNSASDYSDRVIVFRDGNDEPLSIEDLFKPGADWKSAVRTLALRKLAETDYIGVSDPEGYVDEMLGRISGIDPGSEGVQLYFKDHGDIDSRYLSNPDYEWAASNAVGYLEYADLGADILNII